ncbi:MAG: NAD(P)H-dependent oxidoreductase [bacterium]|nr:NAD(P)H-dependent oxidoreductase [bacterium]
MLVLGINASPHREGTGATLLARALEQATKEGAETKTIHLADITMPHYHGDLEVEEVDPSLKVLVANMLAVQAIIFSFPIHWFGMNDRMASLLAHLTPLEDEGKFLLEGRVFGLIATCAEDGAASGLERAMLTLTNMGMLMPPYGALFHNITMAENSEDGWQENDLPLMGTSVVRLAKQVAGMTWDYKDMAP